MSHSQSDKSRQYRSVVRGDEKYIYLANWNVRVATMSSDVTKEQLEQMVEKLNGAPVAVSHVAATGQAGAPSAYATMKPERQECCGNTMGFSRCEDCPDAAPSSTRRTNDQALDAPIEVLEWIWHMDLHLTEHDERHAGLALRAAWPHVREYLLKLGEELGQRSAIAAPSWKQQDADMLAAAVDAAIRRGALDPRSEIADCRLDYGKPFTPEEVEEHLSKRRHGKNAAHRRADGSRADG